MNYTAVHHAKFQVIESVLFGERPEELSKTQFGHSLVRFQCAADQFIHEPDITSLAAASLSSRKAFYELIKRAFEDNIESNSNSATQFMRSSAKVIEAGRSHPVKGDSDNQANNYFLQIDKRFHEIKQIFLHGSHPSDVICNSHVVFKRNESADLAPSLLQARDLYRQFTELKLFTALTMLKSEMRCERGFTAVSCLGYTDIALDIVNTGNWMLEGGMKRFGLTTSDMSQVEKCLKDFSYNILFPLREVASQVEQHSEEIAKHMCFSELMQSVPLELEGLALCVINRVLSENAFSRCLSYFTCAETCGSSLIISIPTELLENPSLLYEKVYLLFAESTPFLERVKNKSDNPDLRWNALAEWVRSGTPGLADFILSEFSELKDIKQKSQWRTALVLAGEQASPSEHSNPGDIKKWVEALDSVIDSLIGNYSR